MSFTLPYKSFDIARWVRKFRSDTAEMDRETAAFEAGRRLARGPATLQDLETVARWKSARRIALLSKNGHKDIVEACRTALTSSVDDAVRALQALHGVGVPMASAILTVMNQDEYTVISVRVLEALGQQGSPSIPVYVCYLRYCRQLAKERGVSLRELDQALWAFSKYRGIPE